MTPELNRLKARLNKLLGVVEPDSLVQPGTSRIFQAEPHSMAQQENSRGDKHLGASGSELSTTCTPAWTPTQTPGCTPVCVPERTPEPTLFAVHDQAGIVVGLSSFDQEPDSPLRHAMWILWYAASSNGMRGRWTLASVLEKAYRTQARRDGLDPMPWKTVASALRRLVEWDYKPVTIRGLRRKRLAYLMPARVEDIALKPEATVVDLAAAKRERA